MTLLLSTHLLIQSEGQLERLSDTARTLLDDPNGELIFSSGSQWEISIQR